MLYTMAKVDWSKVRKVAHRDTGRVRGVYALDESDKKELLKLLEEHDGGIVLPIETVRGIFYRGTGKPGAAGMVQALARNIPGFKFGVRRGGEEIAIGQA